MNINAYMKSKGCPRRCSSQQTSSDYDIRISHRIARSVGTTKMFRSSVAGDSGSLRFQSSLIQMTNDTTKQNRFKHAARSARAYLIAESLTRISHDHSRTRYQFQRHKKLIPMRQKNTIAIAHIQSSHDTCQAHARTLKR